MQKYPVSLIESTIIYKPRATGVCRFCFFKKNIILGSRACMDVWMHAPSPAGIHAGCMADRRQFHRQAGTSFWLLFFAAVCP